jgi:hypothetical protein
MSDNSEKDIKKLKAFICFNGYRNGGPADGCLLAFAESANRARSLTWSEFGEYLYTKAWRRPSYDQYAGDKPDVLWSNDQLPNGAAPFFWETETAVSEEGS